MNPLLLIIPFAALMIFLAIASAAAARKRREELMAWAAAHGLSFDPADDYDFEDRLGPAFSCLRRGDHRHANNLLEGSWGGRPVIGFEYHYQTHSTDSKGKRQTYYHAFSAVAIGAPFPLKSLLIRHEGLFDKIAAFVGKEDINFESAEFSRKFHVEAEDRKWAYDVLHARAIGFLLGRPVLSIQFDERWVLAWDDSSFKPAGFGAAADTLAGLLDLLPDYVQREYTARDERSA